MIVKRQGMLLPLFFIFLASLPVRIVWVLYSPPPYYDEVEFILLARSLSKGGGYELSFGTWQSAIPPLLPFMLSCAFKAFGESQILAHLTCILASSLSVITIYFLAKMMYDDKIAFLAAAFTAFNPIHITLASTILSENLFVFLSPLFIMAILKANRPKWAFSISILFALLFITRYTAIYLGIFIFIWMCLVRRKELMELIRSPYTYLGVIVAALILMPWFLIGQHYYGGPLEAAVVYSSMQGPYESLSDLMMFATASASSLVAFPLFLIPAFVVGLKNHKWRTLLILWIASSMFFSAMREPLVRTSAMVAVTYMLRYNFISFPAFAITTGGGLCNWLRGDRTKRARLLIIIMFSVNIASSVYVPYYIRYIRNQVVMTNSYRETSAYLAAHSEPDEYVITNAPPFIAYYSRRSCLEVPGNLSGLMELLSERRSSFVVISFFDYQTDGPPPSYMTQMVEDGYFRLEYALNTSGRPTVYIFRALGVRD